MTLRCRRMWLAVIGVFVCALATSALASASTAPDQPTLTPPKFYVAPRNDGLGITQGKIKHVWMIILENKSYDATFTGLNNNTYLWQTLPSQGALLKQYYGTGHFSQDNYTSMVSGQAPQSDVQADCPDYSAMNGSIDTSGRLGPNPNYGQIDSSA